MTGLVDFLLDRQPQLERHHTFEPRQDITTYELALATRHLFAQTRMSRVEALKLFDDLEFNVRRHFRDSYRWGNGATK